MATSPRSSRSSGASDDDPKLDDATRKRKRMLSNRESARRSRMRKKEHLDDLVKQAARLKKENDQLREQIGSAELRHGTVDADNAAVRAIEAELAERLRSLNSVLRYVEELRGAAAAAAAAALPTLQPSWLQAPLQTVAGGGEQLRMPNSSSLCGIVLAASSATSSSYVFGN